MGESSRRSPMLVHFSKALGVGCGSSRRVASSLPSFVEVGRGPCRRPLCSLLDNLQVLLEARAELGSLGRVEF